MVESLAQRGQGSNKDADGGFARGPDAEVDAVPGGVLRLCDSFELYSLENGANGSAAYSTRSAFEFSEDLHMRQLLKELTVWKEERRCECLTASSSIAAPSRGR